MIFIQYSPINSISTPPKTKLNDLFLKDLNIKFDRFERDFYLLKFGFGKIIFINGAQISDNKLDNWLFPKPKERVLKKEIPNKFLKSIVTFLKDFSIPYITYDIVTQPSKIWLVNENFILTVRFLNLGLKAESISIILTINDENIEPLTSIEIYLNRIEKGEEKTISYLLKSLKPGFYKNYLSITILYKFKENHFKKTFDLSSNTNFIMVKNAIKENESNSDKESILVKFRQLKNKINNMNNFDKLIKLIDIDPSSTISKSRVILESLINRLFEKYINNNKDKKLAKKIKDLKDNHIIGNKIYAWVNTVRILANIIIHPDKDEIIEANEEDALVIVNILLNIIEELFNQNLI